MTTEEIIKGLESVKTECGKHLDEGFAWICKPIDEAIEKLKREPSMDAVSREAVLDEFDKWVNSREKYYEHPVEFARSLMSLPPVPPEIPKGKWIWKERIKGGFATYTGDDTGTGERRTIVCDERRKVKLNFCSICGKVGDDMWLKFCPNCGADMRGVSE